MQLNSVHFRFLIDGFLAFPFNFSSYVFGSCRNEKHLCSFCRENKIFLGPLICLLNYCKSIESSRLMEIVRFSESCFKNIMLPDSLNKGTSKHHVRLLLHFSIVVRLRAIYSGITSSVWIWSSKTVESWLYFKDRLFCHASGKKYRRGEVRNNQRRGARLVVKDASSVRRSV